MDSTEEREIQPWTDIFDASTRFYRSAGQILEWSFVREDLCMDIGCGDGYSSINLIREFPRINNLIGIDLVLSKLKTARNINSDDTIEYRVANILDWSSLFQWRGRISKIVSFNCFHEFKDQRLAFRNVYLLLKPGGSAAIYFRLNCPHFDIIKDLAEHKKWKNFMTDADKNMLEFQAIKFASSHYRKMLEEIGFEVAFCKEKERIFTCADFDECRTLVSVSIPSSKVIPSDQREEFMDYVFKQHKEHSNPLTENGLLYIKHCTISILIRKPITENLEEVFLPIQ